ncbi:hypothetical protein PM082_013440 [Marasmius tenuissimus]|nr:hypothetical protein PM082_013440 [Marasmius tenuissimus]
MKVALCIGLALVVLLVFNLQKLATIDQTESDFSVYFYRQTGICPPQDDGTGGVTPGSKALSTGFMLIVAYELAILILTLIQAYRRGCFRDRGSSSRFVESFISQGQY